MNLYGQIEGNLMTIKALKYAKGFNFYPYKAKTMK